MIDSGNLREIDLREGFKFGNSVNIVTLKIFVNSHLYIIVIYITVVKRNYIAGVSQQS